MRYPTFSLKVFSSLRSTARGIVLVLGAVSTLSAATVDWPSFMAKHDMKWDQLPQNWKEAPFIGNGEIGSMVYQINPSTLRFDVGCSAAHDHRPIEEDDFSEKNVTTLNRGRHFIGHLRVEFTEPLTGGAAHLDFWNAQASGSVDLAKGKAEWHSLVHANEPILYLELEEGASVEGSRIRYVAEKARNPRAVRSKALREPANPDPEIRELADGVQVAVQNLYAGGQTVVAWKQAKEGRKTRLWLSVQHSYPSLEAEDLAVAAVRRAYDRSVEASGFKDWVADHRAWWHAYYPQSFVSTGDAYWDAFYWAQQYKMACATRDKGWIMDNQGPWLQPTAWNSLWWNLNVQIAHSSFATGNRRGMGSALSHRFDIMRDNLALNVAEPYRADSYAIGRSTSAWDLLGHAGQPGTGRPPMDRNIALECGNLLWALHNVDMEYRYWMDTDLRDRVLYPLLVRAVNYYRHFLKEGGDGRLHLPETYSPEYRRAEDCSYDLDVLSWGVGRLIELAAEKGLSSADEPLLNEWIRIQLNLVPVHINETGRMIGKDVALTGAHRHWSHLLAIYPLRTLVPDTEENRQLIQLCLDHWHSFKGRRAGYSATGGACMAALLGDGERAYKFINQLKPFLHRNTFYSELGSLPVIETPLHGATAIQDMLLQSWDGRLRVFPAVPSAWPDAQFHDLRGEGAFLVSAQRADMKTGWVQVHSEKGGEVEVSTQIPEALWTTTGEAQVETLGEGNYRIQTKPRATVLFWPKNQPKPKI